MASNHDRRNRLPVGAPARSRSQTATPTKARGHHPQGGTDAARHSPPATASSAVAARGGRRSWAAIGTADMMARRTLLRRYGVAGRTGPPFGAPGDGSSGDGASDRPGSGRV